MVILTVHPLRALWVGTALVVPRRSVDAAAPLLMNHSHMVVTPLKQLSMLYHIQLCLDAVLLCYSGNPIPCIPFPLLRGRF